MYDSGNRYSNFNNLSYNGGAWKVENSYNTVSDRNAGNMADAPEEPERDNGFTRKLGTTVAYALIFGAATGVTMDMMSHAVASKSNVASTESNATTEIMPNLIKMATKEAAADDTTSSSEGAAFGVLVIVEKAMPSVVAIDVKGKQQVSDFFGRTAFYEASGADSGIIISENEREYLTVVNNHVIENTTNIKVQFIDGKSVDARLKDIGSGADVAMIAVKKSDITGKAKSEIATAGTGGSNGLRVGQDMTAIGSALDYGRSMTVGYPSAKGRTIMVQDGSTGREAKVENPLQIDATINPGNSDGAFPSMQGQVTGVNEPRSVDMKVEDMGYAIPVSSVARLTNQLSSQKTRDTITETDRGYIGFHRQSVDNEAAQKFNMPVSIFVYKIINGDTTTESKLQENDIITKFKGQGVSPIEGLGRRLTRYEKGETAALIARCPPNKSYEEKGIQSALKGRDSVKNATAESGGESGRDNRGNSSEYRDSRGNSGNRSDSSNGDNGSRDGSLSSFQW